MAQDYYATEIAPKSDAKSSDFYSKEIASKDTDFYSKEIGGDSLAPASLSATATQDMGAPRSLPEDIGKSIGSGFIKGGESALRIEQGATNIVGGLINTGLEAIGKKPIEIGQWYGDLANQIEETRQSYYGDPKSFLGKSVEMITGLPSVIALVGSGGEVGVLTKGTEALGGLSATGLAAIATKYPSLNAALAPVIGAIGKGALSGPAAGFGAMGALEAQPQGPWEMAKQAAIGVGQGIVLDKAAKMKLIPGTAVAAGAMAAPTIKQYLDNEGNVTPQDIAASAVMGGAFNILGQKDLNKLHERALSDVKKIPQEFQEFVKGAVDLHFANERKDAIDREIKSTMADKKVDDGIKKQAAIDEKLRYDAELKKQTESFGQEKTKIEKEKDRVVQAEQFKVDEEANQFNKDIDELTGKIDTTTAGIIDQAKSGYIDTINEQLGKRYGKKINTIGGIIERTKPFTLEEEKSFLLQCKADAEAKFVDPTEPEMKRIDARLKQIEGGGVDATRDVGGKKFLFSEVKAKQGLDKAKQYFPPEEFPQLYAQQGRTIPFAELKSRIDNIKSGPDSLAGKIIGNNFKVFVESKLAGTKLAGSYVRLQERYSSARDNLKVLENTVKDNTGDIDIKGGQEFLRKATGLSPDITNTRILAFLEKGVGGSGLIRGVGDVSSSLREMSDRLGQLETNLARLKDPSFRVAQAAHSWVEELRQLESTQGLTLDALASYHEKLTNTMVTEAAKANTEFGVKMTQYKGDKTYFNSLKQQKSKIMSTTSAILYGLVPFHAKLFRMLRAITMASRPYV